jgi:hypothetical protein
MTQSGQKRPQSLDRAVPRQLRAVGTAGDDEARNSDHGSRSGSVDIDRLAYLCQSEVQNFHRPIVCDFDIGGLQIPVDDALFMRRSQGFRNLGGDGQSFIHVNRTTTNVVGQRFSLHKFHHEEVTAPDFFGAVDRSNVRVVQ